MDSPLTTDPELEETIMRVYGDLKDILRRGDLAPGVRANAIHALANVSMIANDLALEFEMLYDLGV
ncbi:MAG: hypothetical protein M1358_04265 [Chloroflexi bacterium]|nr:hypothetical protein [Chloroflexota bacterium]